jgi:hypothetical protein
MCRATLVLLSTCLSVSACLAADIAPGSDSAYKELRTIGFSTEPSISVADFTLKRDAAHFQLNSGTVCFLAPVNGKITGAIFVGEGKLLLTPPLPSEQRSLQLLTKQDEFSESFQRLVLRFTDGTYDEIKAAGKPGPASSCDPGLLADSQFQMRKKLHYNLDARILQDVLSPAAGGLFVAFVHGQHYSDKMILAIDPHGLTDVYPEEIALETYEESKEGVWAAFHYSKEYGTGKASSAQQNNVVHIEHQQLDTQIETSGLLRGKAATTIVARTAGVRVVPFALFPTLRVRSVVGDGGQQLNFVQEDKLQDPQFWVVLPKALAEGEGYTFTTFYDGKEAVMNEGGGNYFPVSREDWYPNAVAGSLAEYTNYDLTFHIPKNMTMAATGALVSESNQGDRNVSVWKTENPITVAGFNFGRFRVLEVTMDSPAMQVLSFANEDAPDWTHGLEGGARGTLSTLDLGKKALGEAELSMRIYSDVFGAIPLHRLQMTQQTALGFGQAWPGLIYLPMLYLFDTTTRHELFRLMQQNADNPYGYFTVVAPHEVAHQWWGHAVGFNSYRDQWMSEGFSDMSASIYLQLVYAKEPQKYRKFWADERRLLTERNTKGYRAIDTGALTMGSRVANTKEGYDSYRRLVYPKGAYVLHMIRQMMWDRENGDERFKKMMHDFLAAYMGKAATTEDFQAMVEKHMSPGMNLLGDNKMDWFFREYVYGTSLPSYAFNSSFDKNSGGDIVMKFTLTQSGVDDKFAVPVPLYLELQDGSIARLGSAKMVGNNTLSQTVTLPGLKEIPRHAMINYNFDVLAAN